MINISTRTIICLVLFAQQLCYGQVTGIPKSGLANSFTIGISFKGATEKDTLYLAIVDIAYPSSMKYNKGWYRATLKNGLFSFTVPVKEKSGYWDLYKNRRTTASIGGTDLAMVMQSYYWEAGDGIRISLTHSESIIGIHSVCSFSGKGSVKYMARYRTDSAYTVPHILGNNVQDFDEKMNYRRYDQPAIDKALVELEKYKGKMSLLSYEVLKADIRFRDEYNNYGRIRRFYNSLAKSPDSIREAFLKTYDRYIRQPDTKGIEPGALSGSIAFRRHLYNKYFYESYMFAGGYEPEKIFKSIVDGTSGLLRDRLMIYAIYEMPKIKNADLILKQARASLSDGTYVKALENLELTMPGRPFPDFDLPDIDGKRIRLSDFKGKKVLIDFWFNGCGYCEVFYKNTLSKIEHDFIGDESVVFISICADATRQLWQSGIQSGNYTSASAVNLNTDGKGFKHPIVLKNNINGFPFVVLLDKDGKVVARNETWLYDYGKLSEALRK